MSRELPAKANLEHLKKQAKRRLRELAAAGPEPAPRLSDAQHSLAREYGFAGWAELKEQVKALERARRPFELLEAGGPVEERGEHGMTALQWAAWHGNAEMVLEILLRGPQLERKDNEHRITALGAALHGSVNGWHRHTGDYAATLEALVDAGAKAPVVDDDLEASDAARAVLATRNQLRKRKYVEIGKRKDLLHRDADRGRCGLG